MSCNGCRVLRKGCNENCILRQSLTAFETAQAQANATVFVAKFFGRAGLLSFLSAVPEYQRPALFQSLLLEACGRTVNPVNGAVGLLWTGKWHLCQSAVATVLRGGTIKAMPELLSAVPTTDSDDASEAVVNCSFDDKAIRIQESDLQLGLTRSGLKEEVRRSSCGDDGRRTKKLRTTPSLEVSETTTMESGTDSASSQTKLLQLFL
ncbi:putative transcription factor AS2-LOB family [Helianthus anomalus]